MESNSLIHTVAFLTAFESVRVVFEPK